MLFPATQLPGARSALWAVFPSDRSWLSPPSFSDLTPAQPATTNDGALSCAVWNEEISYEPHLQSQQSWVYKEPPRISSERCSQHNSHRPLVLHFALFLCLTAHTNHLCFQT